jgi:hypothetical protein
MNDGGEAQAPTTTTTASDEGPRGAQAAAAAAKQGNGVAGLARSAARGLAIVVVGWLLACCLRPAASRLRLAEGVPHTTNRRRAAIDDADEAHTSTAPPCLLTQAYHIHIHIHTHAQGSQQG